MPSGVSSVALGDNHTCAIKMDGSLWCWGNNEYGQLGDGTNMNKNTPTYIMSLGSGGGGVPSIREKASFDNGE
jgi:alpha-tubulin suppressor-like RCC1 family protein